MRETENALATTGAVLGLGFVAGFASFTGGQWVGFIALIVSGLVVSGVFDLGFGYSIAAIAVSVLVLGIAPRLFSHGIFLALIYWMSIQSELLFLISIPLYIAVFFAYCNSMPSTFNVERNGITVTVSMENTVAEFAVFLLLVLGAAYYWEFNIYHLIVSGGDFILWFITTSIAYLMVSEEVNEKRSSWLKAALTIMLTYWFFAIAYGFYNMGAILSGFVPSLEFSVPRFNIKILTLVVVSLLAVWVRTTFFEKENPSFLIKISKFALNTVIAICLCIWAKYFTGSYGFNIAFAISCFWLSFPLLKLIAIGVFRIISWILLQLKKILMFIVSCFQWTFWIIAFPFLKVLNKLGVKV
ncbi:MAG: hypothetical protein ACPG5R_03050 [Cognaticolwellia aestuarii]